MVATWPGVEHLAQYIALGRLGTFTLHLSCVWPIWWQKWHLTLLTSVSWMDNLDKLSCSCSTCRRSTIISSFGRGAMGVAQTFWSDNSTFLSTFIQHSWILRRTVRYYTILKVSHLIALTSGNLLKFAGYCHGLICINFYTVNIWFGLWPVVDPGQCIVTGS